MKNARNANAAPLSKNAADSQELTRLFAQSNVEADFAKSYIEQIELAKDAKLFGYFPQTHIDSRDRIFQPVGPVIPGQVLSVGRNLNADAFVAALHSDLAAASISGYTLRLRRDDVVTHTMYWNWARRPQDPAELGWKPDIKMHVASVSKLVTSIAVIKLLRDKGLSYDTPVSPYMPAYLAVGQNLAGLTFRHLLSHRSGWRQAGDVGVNDGYDYANFKTLYANGVNAVDIGQYRYHNGNFIALRVAMSVLSGSRSRDDTPGSADIFWDTASASDYVRYVRQNVFLPAFTQAALKPCQ
jgi:hypothetical protein